MGRKEEGGEGEWEGGEVGRKEEGGEGWQRGRKERGGKREGTVGYTNIAGL